MPALHFANDMSRGHITEKLSSSLHRKVESVEPADFDSQFQETVSAAAKQVLLQKVEFTPARKPFSYELDKLKSKYIRLNPSATPSKASETETSASGSRSKMEGKHMPDDGIPPPKRVLFAPEKVRVQWDKVAKVGVGLDNMGNTCFLNSVIQCLSYTAPLVNHLMSEHQQSCRVSDWCMMCELGRHLHRVFNNPNAHSIRPMTIINRLKSIAKTMQFGRQEDAHEFFMSVVNAMQRACLMNCNINPNKNVDTSTAGTTIVYQVFSGFCRSQVRCCRCSNLSNTFDPFLDLPLDIRGSSVQQCLERYVRAEQMSDENAYSCEKCKRKCQAVKKLSIHRAPNVLTISLKRFNNMGLKVTKEVQYSETINLRAYMSQEGPPVIYKLYAVLVHQGFSPHGGHYYCFIKAPNGVWHMMNDSLVRQVGLNTVLSQQAYLLFYVRIPTKETGATSAATTGSTPVKIAKNGPQGIAKTKVNTIVTSGVPRHAFIGPQLPPHVKKAQEAKTNGTVSNGPLGIHVPRQNPPAHKPQAAASTPKTIPGPPKVEKKASIFRPSSIPPQSQREKLAFSIKKLSVQPASAPAVAKPEEAPTQQKREDSLTNGVGTAAAAKVNGHSGSAAVHSSGAGMDSIVPYSDEESSDSEDEGKNGHVAVSAKGSTNGSVKSQTENSERQQKPGESPVQPGPTTSDAKTLNGAPSSTSTSRKEQNDHPVTPGHNAKPEETANPAQEKVNGHSVGKSDEETKNEEANSSAQQTLSPFAGFRRNRVRSSSGEWTVDDVKHLPNAPSNPTEGMSPAARASALQSKDKAEDLQGAGNGLDDKTRETQHQNHHKDIRKADSSAANHNGTHLEKQSEASRVPGKRDHSSDEHCHDHGKKLKTEEDSSIGRDTFSHSDTFNTVGTNGTASRSGSSDKESSSSSRHYSNDSGYLSVQHSETRDSRKDLEVQRKRRHSDSEDSDDSGYEKKRKKHREHNHHHHRLVDKVSRKHKKHKKKKKKHEKERDEHKLNAATRIDSQKSQRKHKRNYEDDPLDQDLDKKKHHQYEKRPEKQGMLQKHLSPNVAGSTSSSTNSRRLIPIASGDRILTAVAKKAQAEAGIMDKVQTTLDPWLIRAKLQRNLARYTSEQEPSSSNSKENTQNSEQSACHDSQTLSCRLHDMCLDSSQNTQAQVSVNIADEKQGDKEIAAISNTKVEESVVASNVTESVAPLGVTEEFISQNHSTTLKPVGLPMCSSEKVEMSDSTDIFDQKFSSKTAIRHDVVLPDVGYDPTECTSSTQKKESLLPGLVHVEGSVDLHCQNQSSISENSKSSKPHAVRVLHMDSANPTERTLVQKSKHKHKHKKKDKKEDKESVKNDSEGSEVKRVKKKKKKKHAKDKRSPKQKRKKSKKSKVKEDSSSRKSKSTSETGDTADGDCPKGDVISSVLQEVSNSQTKGTANDDHTQVSGHHKNLQSVSLANKEINQDNMEELSKAESEQKVVSLKRKSLVCVAVEYSCTCTCHQIRTTPTKDKLQEVTEFVEEEGCNKEELCQAHSCSLPAVNDFEMGPDSCPSSQEFEESGRKFRLPLTAQEQNKLVQTRLNYYSFFKPKPGREAPSSPESPMLIKAASKT